MGRKPLPENEALERQRVGATIRALRESQNHKPDEFACKVGISRPYLMNIEAGRKPLTWDLLSRIAEALSVGRGSIARQDYFEDAA